MQARTLILVASCLGASLGCAGHVVVFQDSPELPAALATATIRSDENRNTLVELELQHVAPAAKLWPPRSTYIVWAESSEGRIFQLGQLHVNERREGSFRGTTALDHLRLIITAENDPRPEQPSTPYMLATDFFSAELPAAR